MKTHAEYATLHSMCKACSSSQQILQQALTDAGLGTAYPIHDVLILAAGQATAKPGLQALLDICQARQPQLVEQMAAMMTELEHMSVLWIEQWHIALLELQVLFDSHK